MTFQCLEEVETSPGYRATCNMPDGHTGNHRGIIRGPRFFWSRMCRWPGCQTEANFNPFCGPHLKESFANQAGVKRGD